MVRPASRPAPLRRTSPPLLPRSRRARGALAWVLLSTLGSATPTAMASGLPVATTVSSAWAAPGALPGVAGAAGIALPTLDGLPRPSAPPLERGPVVPAQVERWREEAKALEHGDGLPRDPVRAAELYCRAARHGDAEAQYNLAWMLTNARGIERNDAQAAHLFAAAAEQGLAQARNMAERLGTPMGDPPACLRPPAEDAVLLARQPPPVPPPAGAGHRARPGGTAATAAPPPPIPAHAPPQIVQFVQLVAPDYQLEPWLVLAVIAAESNFDPGAVSPKRAVGLMQLIPETAARFGVRNPSDPVQNLRGGMAYLRWLLAYFEGDVMLALAAYNAGEGAVERYRGVPPYAETRHYVRKILGATGYRLSHRFDPTVTGPSRLAGLIREQMKPR